VVMVMEEGTNTRVLARLEHYELAGAGWMAAQTKLAEGEPPLPEACANHHAAQRQTEA
jgi:hypothetical protein